MSQAMTNEEVNQRTKATMRTPREAKCKTAAPNASTGVVGGTTEEIEESGLNLPQSKETTHSL